MTDQIDPGFKQDMENLLPQLKDPERVFLLLQILQSVEFKGTIHQIRELVNDPKWNDKV